MERLVKAAVVGADREEADDDHAERDTDDEPHDERFHLLVLLTCVSLTRYPLALRATVVPFLRPRAVTDA